ncbi:MAG TPA: carboxypeptidase regulatory-like domain-containing protein [Planctomycetota bacterium]|nr:carboxypeptidase regulatory-like domain-containing protein [Planctomycetota bacterium]
MAASSRSALAIAVLAAGGVVIALYFARVSSAPATSAPASSAPTPSSIEPARAVASDAASGLAAKPRAATTVEPPAGGATPPKAESTIEFPPPTGVSGIVVDAVTGLPIREFYAYASPEPIEPEDPFRSRFERGFRSDEGAFEIINLVPGRIRVVARAGNYLEGTSDSVEIAKGAISANVVVRLRQAATIRVRVVDAATGDPIRDASVHLTRTGSFSPIPEDGFAPSRPAGDGSFEFSSVPPETFQVAARTFHRGYVDAMTVPFVPAVRQVTEVSIALRRGGVIEGVATRIDGSPLTAGWASARLDEPDKTARTRRHPVSEQLGSGGRFRIEGLETGTWIVEVRTNRGEPDPLELRGTTRVVEGETSIVALHRSACAVRGRVVRAGRPVPSALVHIWRLDEADPETGSPRIGVSDSTGAFTTSAMPGTNHVTVEVGSERTWRRVVVPDEPSTDLAIELPAGGTIEGRVHRRDGGALAGVRVTLLSAAGIDGMAASADTRTDVEGRFVFTDVRSGAQSVQAIPDAPLGLAACSASVNVEKGRAAKVELTLESGGSVVVEVLDADGKRVEVPSIVTLCFADRADTVASGVATAQDGFARFERVARGTYVARVWGFGSTPMVYSGIGEVAAGREIKLTVQRRRGVQVIVRAVSPSGETAHVDHARVTGPDGRLMARAAAIDPSLVADVAVLPGRLRIEVASGELRGEVTVDVGDPPPREIVVKLDPKPQDSR